MGYKTFLLSTCALLMATLLGCSESGNSANAADEGSANIASAPDKEINLAVYKSPTCGCCEDWVVHVDANGFRSTVHHPEDLNAVKQQFGIAPKYQSCHTGVTDDGYVFEGHVPARLVKQFLREKPANAIGLAVPGMPIGSPGMEMGDRVQPYDVLLLHKDGTTSVYARVTTLEKQGS